jgi:membrane protein YdbS with pleckstrin-like domain
VGRRAWATVKGVSTQIDTQIGLRPPRHPVDRRALRWWRLRALVVLVVLAGGLGLGYGLAAPARPWLGPPLVAAVLLGPAYLLVMPPWRYRVHRWEVTDLAVYAATGWCVREWRVAPISRIQTVDTTRGPLEQLLGLATLVVTTASASGAIHIRGLDQEVATRAAAQLTELTQRTPGDAT